MMVQRFSADCRRVVGRAQLQARQLGHPFLGTEHLLLAVLEDAAGGTVAALRSSGVDIGTIRRKILLTIGERLDADALTSLGIDLQRVQEVAEGHFGPGALTSTRRSAPTKGHLPLTRRVKTVLEMSALAARRLGHHAIGPEHLMLGILDEGSGIAVRVLKDANVRVAELRLDIATQLARDVA